MRLVVAAIVLTASAAAAQSVATLRGRVVDRATKHPVAGAVITVGGEFAATDDDGGFAVAIAPGRYTIEVSAEWLVTKREPVVIKADTELVIEVDAAEHVRGETIEVIDIAPTQIGQTKIDAKLARAVPGGGDAVKVVQSLPAVARPPAGSAEIVVWGAAPRDTRVFVDGVPVPATRVAPRVVCAVTLVSSTSAVTITPRPSGTSVATSTMPPIASPCAAPNAPGSSAISLTSSPATDARQPPT